MLSHYIDMDTRKAKVYVVPVVQNKDHPYMILAVNRYEAETILKKLSYSALPLPFLGTRAYSLLEVVKDKNNRSLYIYEMD